MLKDTTSSSEDRDEIYHDDDIMPSLQLAKYLYAETSLKEAGHGPAEIIQMVATIIDQHGYLGYSPVTMWRRILSLSSLA